MSSTETSAHESLQVWGEVFLFVFLFLLLFLFFFSKLSLQRDYSVVLFYFFLNFPLIFLVDFVFTSDAGITYLQT